MLLDIIYISESCSPTLQRGSHADLLQMFLHMHIHTALWIRAHIVSLGTHEGLHTQVFAF